MAPSECPTLQLGDFLDCVLLKFIGLRKEADVQIARLPRPGIAGIAADTVVQQSSVASGGERM